MGYAVIFLSNPTIVLRLGWGFDDNIFFQHLLNLVLGKVKNSSPIYHGSCAITKMLTGFSEAPPMGYRVKKTLVTRMGIKKQKDFPLNLYNSIWNASLINCFEYYL